MISQKTVMSNLSIMTRDGIQIRPGDRGMSWLPFYHDMGLVGLVLGALAAQMSVDYLSPLDFVMRPRLWLTIMSQNRATISFSPPVGYELALKRIKKDHIDTLDLSAWRVAGVGAEPIRIEPLHRFAEVMKPSGFDQKALVAGYGMAETSLGVSFSSLGQGLRQDCFVELVPRHTLPRTTSGKLSRSKARQDFLKRQAASQMPPVEMTRTHAHAARPAV
jgi:fatty-acyl-CoA synthase